MRQTVAVNGRDYAWPRRPTVVVCVDGSEPDYMKMAIASGLAPNLERLMRTGSNLRAEAAMPRFTNPNNISIITGVPPAVQGSIAKCGVAGTGDAVSGSLSG